MEAFEDLPSADFDAAISQQRTAVLKARVAADRPAGPLGLALGASLPVIGARVREVAATPSGLRGVRESDLVLFAFLEGQSSTLEGRPLRREVSSGLTEHWRSPANRTVGAWDLAVEKDSRSLEAVEAKWIWSDKSHELLWDVLKLAQAIALASLESGYLLVGISEPEQQRAERPTELLGGGSWATRTLLADHPKSWGWLSRETSTRPVGGLPAGVATSLMVDPVALGEGALLALLQVGASGETVMWDEAADALHILPPRR